MMRIRLFGGNEVYLRWHVAVRFATRKAALLGSSGPGRPPRP